MMLFFIFVDTDQVKVYKIYLCVIKQIEYTVIVAVACCFCGNAFASTRMENG